MTPEHLRNFLSYVCAGLQELKEVTRSKDNIGLTLRPNDDNIYIWNAQLIGPEGTPYHGGTFTVVLVVKDDYPLVPPTARFQTRIFHPNVHFKTGEVCLDILKTQWTPAWTIVSVCQAILAMLSDPNADSPLNCDAGNLIRNGDTRGFDAVARMYTIDLASGNWAYGNWA